MKHYIIKKLSSWIESAKGGEFTESELEVHVSGNEKSDEIIYFIHGFPDNYSLWKTQVEALEKNYQCVCITLPGFESDAKMRKRWKWGYDFSVIARTVASHIESLTNENNLSLERKHITLVTHDFGSIIGGMLFSTKIKSTIQKWICVDVADGGEFDFENHRKQLLLFLFYQWFLLIVFLLFPPFLFGNWLTRIFAWVVNAPLTRQKKFMCFHSTIFQKFVEFDKKKKKRKGT
ncbi:hypothetical protein RFI_18563 [Reticulomyxa filosa]|uniref:AB hydrolase-1 domain-containing protein n=1 Tax=Reticulomyxa filosa TaxID=46433 RepID=X6MYI2_RETFI|nr:hypothetical protein RFI_18563 [Reticulomyxa filosa]|eukprot:ETO18693.1 hypothetical protein RFI_18563 [Reticulomyxa filosa]